MFVHVALQKPGHRELTFLCRSKLQQQCFAYCWSFQLNPTPPPHSFSSPTTHPLGLRSNKEISLGAKYFPLRVFKHLGSLLLFLCASEVPLCSLSVFLSLPAVFCDVDCRRAQMTQTGRPQQRQRERVRVRIQCLLL